MIFTVAKKSSHTLFHLPLNNTIVALCWMLESTRWGLHIQAEISMTSLPGIQRQQASPLPENFLLTL
jgi:hypothetical protein